MITLLLAMICGGVALTQCVSDPKEVTLRWLRLGALISLALIGSAVMAEWLTEQLNREMIIATSLIILFQGGQLMAVQLAKRNLQRVLAGLVCFVVVGISWLKLAEIRVGAIEGVIEVAGITDASGYLSLNPMDAIGLGGMSVLAPALVGGYLMSMLLGHAYLSSAGEMTQKPFRRLVIMLLVLLGIRAAISLVTGLWPYYAPAEDSLQNQISQQSGQAMWNGVMLFARYMVGFVVPLIFTWMVDDCVKRRSNQSATGILYVASVLVLVGEGVSLALLGAIGLPF